MRHKICIITITKTISNRRFKRIIANLIFFPEIWQLVRCHFKMVSILNLGVKPLTVHNILENNLQNLDASYGKI